MFLGAHLPSDLDNLSPYLSQAVSVVLVFILNTPKYKGTDLPTAAYGLIGISPPRGSPAAAIQRCDGC